MVPPTRRRVLQGAVGALAALAGCNDAVDGSGDATALPGPDGEHVETDPDHLLLRAGEYTPGRPLVWFDDGDESAGRRETTRPGTVPRSDGESSGFIASEERAATIRAAGIDEVTGSAPRTDAATGTSTDTSDPSADGASAVRAFVEATDFDGETLYLDHRPVEECYQRILCYVTWTEHELETRYGRFLRDHDVTCETGAQDAFATLVRIPAALDPSVVEDGGSGVSNGYCFAPPGERGRPTATETATRTGDGTTDGSGPTTGEAGAATDESGPRTDGGNE